MLFRPVKPVIGIVTNREKDPGMAFTKAVRDFLTGRGVDVRVGEYPDDAEFWVVLGGDGTMLRVSHQAAIKGVPLLGINLGNLGFLTDVDKNQGMAALDRVLSGQYVLEKRLMLEVEFGAGAPVPLDKRIALNEVCVGVTGQLKSFSVYVNEQHMDVIRADGIIVATPTGSTAYSLSAGGPILNGGSMMVITPVCPHSLSTRPWVVSAYDTVRIISRQKTSILVDGEVRGETSPGESVFINKADCYAEIIKTAPAHFYAVLRKKKIL